MKIIVRMPNWLGDAVMASAALANLRKHFSKASISLLAKGEMGRIFDADCFFSTDSVNIDMLKAQQFDLGVLFTNSFSSAFLFWRAGIPSIGYRGDGRSFLLKYPLNLKNVHY